MEDDKKKVDEAWKEAAENEKTGIEQDVKAEDIKASFNLFISGLMMEATIALGDMENPLTKKRETNLVHAKYVIDILDILKEKTKNNLTTDETAMLNSILYELRMCYVTKTNAKKE